MAKKRFLRYILISALAICLLLTGCSGAFSVETMLTPPQLSEEQTAMYNALTAAAGRVELRYPRTGSFFSAFVTAQLDDEQGMEALVFYESRTGAQETGSGGQSSAAMLRIGFLDKNESGEWRMAYELPASGAEVESVSFSDLGCGKLRALVSFSMINSMNRSLMVIDYTDGVASILNTLIYSEYLVTDFTGQGKEELLVFDRNPNANKAQMTLYACDGEGLLTQLYNTVPLQRNITEYNKIIEGKCRLLKNEMPCVAVDYIMSDNQYGTEVIYFNGKSLVSSAEYMHEDNVIPYSRKTNSFTPNIHTTVNQSGILSVPVTATLPTYEGLTAPEQLMAYIWYEQSAAGAPNIAYTYIDSGANFMLTFPSRWIGMVTVTVNPAENTAVFWKVPDENRSDLEVALLSIKVVKMSDKFAEDCAEAEQLAYKLFVDDGETYIYAKNLMYEQLSLTEDELKASLSMVSEDMK